MPANGIAVAQRGWGRPSLFVINSASLLGVNARAMLALAPRRSSRLPQGPAAGHVATLCALIFTSAAIQSPKGPTANATARWPIWRRTMLLLHPSPCLSRQQEPQTVDLSVEQLIGELVAATACLFAQGLGECWARGKMNGQMSADTREHGRALIAGLVELRNGTAGELDFNVVARSHGARVLKDRYGQGVSDRTVHSLVNAALEVLGRIARARLN